MTLQIRVKGRWLDAVVDCGAFRNYIDPRVVNDLKLPWKEKKDPYPVINTAGDKFSYNNGYVLHEIDHLKTNVCGRNTGITYDVVPILRHDVILGHPWLKRYNPSIDWPAGQIEALRGDGDSDWENDSDDTRSQTSTDTDSGEVRQRQQTPSKPQWQKKQQGKKKAREIRRVIGRIMRQLEDLNDMLEKQPDKANDKLRNIPPQYRIYEKLFREELETGLPEHSEWDLTIEFIDGTKPGFSKLYSLNEAQLGTLKEYLEEMLKKGYIRASKSPSAYPVMFVPKKNGKLRLVVDYRKLNDITVKDRTPLPLINELKDRLHGMKVFTALDLKGAYNLIRIAKGEEWKTAFRTKFGLFEYLVMPFGLTNAPAAFQRMINSVLREHLDVFVVCYLDDILIFSKNEEEHTEHVHKVLQLLQDAKLLVEPEKSHFHQKEVEFLGHIISHNEIRMDPKKIAAVRDWKRPTNLKEVQAFLGFANYYRKFLRNFGKTAASLTELTKKGVDFRWTPERQQAFDKIKNLILSEPVLAMFDPEREIELETDASDFALGAQIGQRDEQGKLHPIAFYSHKLHGPEERYPIYDKEFLAIVNAFKEFRHYLMGSKHKIKVYTDHKNISHFATTQELNGRQLRYAEYLSEFDYVIIHRKGSENGRADAISRRPDLEEAKIQHTGQLFRQTPEGHLEQLQTITLGRIRKGTYQHPKVNKEEAETTYDHIVHEEAWEKHLDDIMEFGEYFGPQGEEGPDYQKCIRIHGGRLPLPNDMREDVIKDYKEANPGLGTQELYELMTRTYCPCTIKEEQLQQSEEAGQPDILKYHEHPLHGHEGVAKTQQRLRRYGIIVTRKEVERALKTCDICAKTKARRHKPYGLLQPIPVAGRPWESITMDFITKLPISQEPATGNLYDSILVVMDTFSKMACYIPYKEATTAEEFAYLFYKHIVSTHGIPRKILSDRGPPFASKFWQALTGLLGWNHRLTTAFRPSVDGQTERQNQELEQYLRCYVNHEQNNWVEKLPAAQLAYNTSYHSSIKTTPMFANHGFTTDTYEEARKGPLNVKAMLKADDLRSLHKEMQEELKHVQYRMKQYYDKKRIEGPTFEEGEMVLLSTKNLTTNRPSKKLDYKFIGPFPVKKKISESNYELDLPREIRVHPVFHVSLLETTQGNVMVRAGQDKLEVESPEEYEPEKIIKHRVRDNKNWYLIKWKNYPNSENTWEPIEHLAKSQRLLKNYHQQTRRARAPPN